MLHLLHPCLLQTRHHTNTARRTGHIAAVLAWWGINFSATALYKYAAKSLLSLATVGSITVERAAKTLKNMVWTKHNARMGAASASMLLRLGMNLRLLQILRSRNRESVVAAVTDALLRQALSQAIA